MRAPGLKAAGFRRRRNAFDRPSSDTVTRVVCSRARHRPRRAFDRHGHQGPPPAQRIGALIERGDDVCWKVSHPAADIDRLLREVALPWLDDPNEIAQRLGLGAQ